MNERLKNFLAGGAVALAMIYGNSTGIYNGCNELLNTTPEAQEVVQTRIVGNYGWYPVVIEEVGQVVEIRLATDTDPSEQDAQR